MYAIICIFDLAYMNFMLSIIKFIKFKPFKNVQKVRTSQVWCWIHGNPNTKTATEPIEMPLGGQTRVGQM